ncbi:hypothetical protein [Aminobacter aganoensis]|uniref:hypothetical protein n=1 Tax=Aminobacter aganoensis TaxID=83264 RepID=UPI0031E678C2
MGDISVLVVEDGDEKFEAVRRALFPSGSYRRLDRAPDFSTAQRQLEANHYDLVILDIRVPVLRGGSPASKNSADIVELITRGQAINPSYIIDLTEFPEELSANSSYPLEYFSIEKYSSISDEWKFRLSRHIEYIKRTKIASVNFHDSSFDYDAVILTARHDNEFVPIVNAMSWEKGTLSDDGRFPGFKVKTGVWNTSTGFALKAAVVCIQRAGLASAAAATSLAISRYKPKIVSMLGMCCGLNNAASSDPQKLGDVVIMSDTFCWDEGRYSDTKRAKAGRMQEIAFFEARPVSGNISPALKMHAENLSKRAKNYYRRNLRNYIRCILQPR